MSAMVTVDETGAMQLPVELRRKLGVEGGGAVLVSESDGGVEITPAPYEPDSMRALLDEIGSQMGDYTVDDFIREKREQAVLEAAKLDGIAWGNDYGSS